MANNIIFYFSGTGNSLKLSKDISKIIGDCDIVSMSRKEKYTLNKKYNQIGFVLPTYFQGIPIHVSKFIENLEFSENKNSYIFAIATYGLLVGNAVQQVEAGLNKKNVRLSYANKIKMFSNYVVMYDMSKNLDKITKNSDVITNQIAKEIKNKKFLKPKKTNFIIEKYYTLISKKINKMDQHFNVSNECISCGICKEVCVAENIELKNGKPTFKNKCEQCVACIQYCPKKAINYKNITQKRRRYTNPSINYKDLNKDFLSDLLN